MHRTTRRVALAAAIVLSALPITSTSPTPAAAAVTPVSFTETFTGKPPSPTPWTSPNWDVTVHSRGDNNSWFNLEPMAAQHGPTCGPPSETHTMNTFEGAVFQCNDHMMTSIKSEGYGVIYLTPNHLVDLSAGTATVSWDISTLRTSGRDWWDVWITPFDDNVQLAGEDWYPDLNGVPRNGIRVGLTASGNIAAELVRDFQHVPFPGMRDGRITGDATTSYDRFLTPSPKDRTTFQIQLSRNHIRVGMPATNSAGVAQPAFWWVDADIPTLSWDSGVVQFGHHSYNPTKDCGSTNPPGPDGQCKPNTWHWDNVSINPALPFTMLHADRRYVAQDQASQITFPSPSPEGSFLRFSGIGDDLEVSYNGGASWQAATMQPSGKPHATEHFQSYWSPMPAGTQTVLFRGRQSWAGPWQARDITAWSTFDPPTATIPVVAPSTQFVGFGPERFLESRPADAPTVDGESSNIGLLAAGTVTAVRVAGRHGVPGNARAVTLNITATEPRAPGFLTVFPCDIPRPTASNINFVAGQTIAGAVTSKTAPDGTVCVFTNATTHVIADVTGYFPAGAVFQPISPTRYLETRPGDLPTFDGGSYGLGLQPAGATVQVPIAGRGGLVPGSADAVTLNVTATGARQAGFLTVYPCGGGRPVASNLNFDAGQTIANSVTTKVGAGGAVCVFTNVATHIILDVNGYFPGGGAFTALTPARLMETRPAQLSTADGRYRSIGMRTAGSITELVVSGRGGVPVAAAVAALNITATGSQRPGFVTVFACGTGRPLASNLNFAAGQTVANSVVSRIGPGGKVCIFTNTPTHLIVDVSGVFTGSVVPGFASPAASAAVSREAPAAATVRGAARNRSDALTILCRLRPTR